MVTITLGRWQMAGLVASLLLLVLVSVLAGFAAATLSGHPAASVVASSGASSSSAASRGAAGATAESRGGDTALIGGFEARNQKMEISEEAAGTARETASDVVRPAADAVNNAARRFLPPWLSSQVGRATHRAEFIATDRLGGAAQAAAEDTVNGGLSQGRALLGGAPPPLERRYTLELARFATAANAESFAASAARRGVDCAVEYAPSAGQPAAYAVRSGRFASADEAEASADSLKTGSGIAATVVALAETGARPSP